MRASKERRLWVGFAASIVFGVMLHAFQLWASGDPLWPVIQVLLDVGFWFSMTSAALLAVLALRLGVLLSPGRGRATTALLTGLAIALGVAFVVLMATRNWLIFSLPESGAPTGYLSLIVDAFLGLVEVSAGSLIALAMLTILTPSDASLALDNTPGDQGDVPTAAGGGEDPGD